MWAAWIVAAIGLAGVTFMLRFLVALLGEGRRWFASGLFPVRGRPERVRHLEVLRGIYVDENYRATEGDRRLGVLENDYAKEESDSGFIGLDVPHIADGLGWRPVHSRRGYAGRERRL